MNSSPSSSPRFFCRVVRQWHAVAGGGARHVDTCADCRAYFHSAAALDQTLRRTAPAWQKAETPAPSTGFEQRLLNAVRADAAPQSARPTHLGWAAASTFAAVVAVALFYRNGEPVGKTAETEAALLAQAVSTASRGLVEKVIPSTGALVADNPMQREFGAIAADARSAIGFLAMNFLPVPGAAESGAGALRPN